MPPKYPTQIVLTLDAFGTLYKPREPIAKQYLAVAKQHGLLNLTLAAVEQGFRTAFQRQQMIHPNYGKAKGMTPSQWWERVIRSTFTKHATGPLSQIPPQLVADLISRFSSSQGYELFPDVLPFFARLREARQEANDIKTPGIASRIKVGVISNSDDRVLPVLDSLGIKVNPRRHGMQPGLRNSSIAEFEDISFVAMNYDVGIKKPEQGIFNAAKRLSGVASDADAAFVHVGDSYDEDIMGAQRAGWKGILLDRGDDEESKSFRARFRGADNLSACIDLLECQQT